MRKNDKTVNSIFCIFDCIIKQKDCVFMYVVAIKDRHCLELLSFTHPYIQDGQFRTPFYIYMKAFLNILTLFFIHPVQYAV